MVKLILETVLLIKGAGMLLFSLLRVLFQQLCLCQKKLQGILVAGKGLDLGNHTVSMQYLLFPSVRVA